MRLSPGQIAKRRLFGHRTGCHNCTRRRVPREPASRRRPTSASDTMDSAPPAANEPAAGPTSPDLKAPKRPHSLSHRVMRGGAWSLAGRIGSMGSLFLLNVVLARLGNADYSAFL